MRRQEPVATGDRGAEARAEKEGGRAGGVAGGVAGGGGGRAAAAAAGVSGAAGCRRTPRQAFPKPSCARPPGPGPQRASPLLVALTPSPTPPCRIAGAPQVASALCARGNFPPRPGLCQPASGDSKGISVSPQRGRGHLEETGRQLLDSLHSAEAGPPDTAGEVLGVQSKHRHGLSSSADQVEHHGRRLSELHEVSDVCFQFLHISGRSLPAGRRHLGPRGSDWFPGDYGYQPPADHGCLHRPGHGRPAVSSGLPGLLRCCPREQVSAAVWGVEDGAHVGLMTALSLQFFIFILVIFLVELSAAILAFIFREHLTREFFTRELTKHYQGNNDTDVFSATWNSVMITFGCCGVNGPEDFKTASVFRLLTLDSEEVPTACCRREPQTRDGVLLSREECQRGRSPFINKQGCYTVILNTFETYVYLAGAFAIGVLAIELFLMIFAMCLFRGIQ